MSNSKEQPLPALHIPFPKDQFSKHLDHLRRIPDNEIFSMGPIPLWRNFRSLGFAEGELVLCRHLTDQKVEQPLGALLAADTYLLCGQHQFAEDALIVAVKSPPNSKHFHKFIALALQVKNNELCEAVFDMFANEHSMKPPEKVNLGIHFSNLCDTSNMRYLAVRCLRDLAEKFQDETKLLDLVANELVRIKEYSMAVGIRERLAKLEPKNKIWQLDVLLVRSRFDRDGIPKILAKIVERPDDTKEFWERVSWIYQFLGVDYMDFAISAGRRLLMLGGDEIGIRRQLAAMYLALGQRGKVRFEILQILNIEFSGIRVGAHVLRHLAIMAGQIGDTALAERCTHIQFKASLFTDDALKEINRPATEWLELALEAKKLKNYDLELEMIRLGLTCHPNDRKLTDYGSHVSRQNSLFSS